MSENVIELRAIHRAQEIDSNLRISAFAVYHSADLHAELESNLRNASQMIDKFTKCADGNLIFSSSFS